MLLKYLNEVQHGQDSILLDQQITFLVLNSEEKGEGDKWCVIG